MIKWIRQKLRERRARRDYWRQAASVKDILDAHAAEVSDVESRLKAAAAAKRTVDDEKYLAQIRGIDQDIIERKRRAMAAVRAKGHQPPEIFVTEEQARQLARSLHDRPHAGMSVIQYQDEAELRKLHAEIAAEREILEKRQRESGLDGFLSLTTDLPEIPSLVSPGPSPAAPEPYSGDGGGFSGAGASGSFDCDAGGSPASDGCTTAVDTPCPDSSSSDGGTCNAGE